MIFRILKACRQEELYIMTIHDVDIEETFIVVKNPQLITYMIPIKKTSFYYSNRSCYNQVVGKETIEKWPSKNEDNQ